jgi:hypothetical protein
MALRGIIRNVKTAILAVLFAALAAAQTPTAAAAPPVVPLDIQLDFANAETMLSQATAQRDKLYSQLVAACPAPWALARDNKTLHFVCVEKPKPEAKPEK